VEYGSSEPAIEPLEPAERSRCASNQCRRGADPAYSPGCSVARRPVVLSVVADRKAQSPGTWYTLSVVAALICAGAVLLAVRAQYPGLRWFYIAVGVAWALLTAAGIWRARSPGLQIHMWLQSEEFLIWLSDYCDRHVDELRLRTFTNDGGVVFGASLNSSKDIDLHLDMNWKLSYPSVALRRGQQRVGSWVLSPGLVGNVEKQMIALQEIVQAVVSGNGVLRVGRRGGPRIVLRGVNPGWSKSSVQVGLRVEGRRGTATPLPAWVVSAASEPPDDGVARLAH
jgi:hypothetical protein